MNPGGVPSRAGHDFRTRSWLPPMPPLATITAWAVSSKSPTSSRLVGRPRSAPSGASTFPRTPVTSRRRLDQLVDPVPEGEAQPAGRCVLADPSLERLDDARTGAPGEVEAGHRVAVAVRAPVATLGPADDREDPEAHPAQPGSLLAGREGDVRLGPALRPEVLRAVELGAAHPVGEGQVDAVLDAHPSLLGGVDEEETAQAPERLAAEGLLALLVDQDHPPSGVGDLCCSREPGQAVAHDDDIGVHGRRLRPRRAGDGCQ